MAYKNGTEVGTGYVTIVPNAEGFGQSLSKQILGKTRDVGGRASKSFSDAFNLSTVGQAFGTVAKAGTAALGAVAAAAAGIAAKGGIQRALAIEGAQAKLVGLGHDSADVSAIMSDALASVKGTAFGLGDAATVAATMSASGVQSGEQMRTVLSTVADTAQISGRSMSEVGAIFSSVAARGKLQGDDLLQLTSAGVPVLQFLSKQLGVTTQDVSDMVSRGQIDFETFADAMQAGLGGAAQAAGGTFTGALSNVRAALSRLGAAAATPALDALRVTFNGLIPVIDDATAAAQPLIDALADRLGRAAERAGGLLESLHGRLQGLGQVDLGGLGQTIAGLAPALGALAGPLGGLLSNLPVVGGLFTGLTGPVGVVIGLFGSMLAQSQPLRDALGQLALAVGSSLASAMPTVLDLFSAFGQVLGAVGDAIAPFVQALAGALVAAMPAAITLINGLASALAAVGDWMSSHQGIVSAFLATLLTGFGAIKAIGIAQRIKPVISVAGKLISTLRTASATVHGLSGFLTLAGRLSAVSGPIGKVAGSIVKVSGAAGKAVGVAQKLGVAIKGVMSALAANPIGLVVAAIAALVAGLIYAYQHSETFRNVVQGAWNGIKTAVQAVADWFTGTLVPAFQAVWDGIKAGVEWLWHNVFEPVWEGIKVAVAVVVTAIKLEIDGLVWVWQNLIAPVLEWLWHSVFEPVWNGIRGAIEAVVGWFTGTAWPAIQTFAGWVGDGFNALRDAIGAAWGWIRDNIIGPVVDWFMTSVWPRIIAFKDAAVWEFNMLRDGVGAVWNFIRDNIISPVVDWFTGTVVPRIIGFKDGVVNAFNVMKDGVGAAWGWVRDNIVQPVVDWFTGTVVPRFTSVKDNIVGAFNVMKDGVGAAWDALKELAAKPVRFVVNTVAAGVVETYNTVASKFGAATATVPHVDFASGSYDAREARIADAPILWAEAGPEAYIPLDPAKRARSLDIWRQTGRALGVRMYEDGAFNPKNAIGGHNLGTKKAGDPLSDIAHILGELLKDPIGYLKRKVNDLLAGFASSPFGEVVAGVPRQIAADIGNWLKEHISGWLGAASGSAAFDAWWLAAVAVNPLMAPYKAIAAKVAEMESGFNPTVQNNWDSNAAAGHPSAGLMQFIRPTFEAYKWPGFNDWLGPVDQLLAWWNYVNARYGGPMNIPGIVSMARGSGYVGYARGTDSARRGLAWVGENGPELIRFHGGEQVIPNDRLSTATAGATYVFSPTYYDDGRSVRRDMEDWRHEMAGAFS